MLLLAKGITLSLGEPWKLSLVTSTKMSNIPMSSTIFDYPIIRDNVNDFSEDEDLEMFNETFITDDVGPSNTRLHVTPSPFFTNIYSQQTEDPVGGVDYRLRGSNVWFDNDLAVGMMFESKQETINAIKQYHIKNSFNYLVEESRSERYVAKCVMFGDGCELEHRIT